MPSDPSNEKEYIIFCDESDRRGAFYSNFYGGVRVGASHLTGVETRLNALKQELGLTSEIKWQKVDQGLVERYEQFVRATFLEVASRRIFLRIMFTQNLHVAVGLSEEQQADEYYILYYQFLKHGFGIAHMPKHTLPPRFRIYLDEIGDTKEQVAKFKGFVRGLGSNKSVRTSGGIILEDSGIAEVRSHDHILMQALDVILGAMAFRLNEKHRAIPEGASRRGKRTVAKERLYDFILGEIRKATNRPHFNIGITTGIASDQSKLWSDPYLHWCFKPKNHRVDKQYVKK